MAIYREDVKIYIVAADVNGSALASSDEVKGEITSHGFSGGNRERTSDPAFGGYIQTRSPRGDFEISMDIAPKLTGTASTDDRWDLMKFGSTGASTGEEGAYAIFIQRQNSSGSKTTAFNNAYVTSWEPSHDAGEYEQGSVTFTIAPETSLGAANIKTSALAASSAFFNW